MDTRELKGWFAFLAPTEVGRYDFDIYVFANGGAPVPVTTGSAADLAPAWSPDGSQIAFARNEGGSLETTKDADLWMVGVDGDRLTRLTDTPQMETEPRWSPDGSRIVYVSYPDLDIAPGTDARSSVVLRDLATGEERDLVPAGEPNYDPAWSPDGERLAFVRDPDDAYPEVAVVDIEAQECHDALDQVVDRLLPLKQPIRDLLDPRTTLLVRRPPKSPVRTGVAQPTMAPSEH